MIEARKLTKRYGLTRAVDGLDFEVRPGVVTGFLGPNGAGKSTTMRMIMGLDEPDAGEALVAGFHYRQLRWPLREVGALLEARAFHPGRSARTHLLALAAANAIPVRRVDEVLAMVGLDRVARERAGGFSLGMGQRLGIAAAMLGDPGIVILDEPVNGLDPDGIIWVRNLMKRLAGEGRTVFVSSHLISEIAATADHLIVIGQGHLIADSTVAELTASAGRYVTVRAAEEGPLRALLEQAGASVRRQDDGSLAVTGQDAEAIAQLAADNHVVLYELSTHTASLEEAFLELTHQDVQFHGLLTVGAKQ